MALAATASPEIVCLVDDDNQHSACFAAQGSGANQACDDARTKKAGEAF
jgi:hypothetical protein